MHKDVRRKPWSLLPAMLLWAVCASAGEPLVFQTTSKVWIDPQGTPTKVEVSERVTESVRVHIAKQVSAWRFEPPTVNGVASEGITYLSLRICAVETGQRDALRLAVEYRGNGPGNPEGLPNLPPPRYPAGAASRGITGAWHVEYTIGADGHATVDSVRPEKKTQEGRNYFKPALEQWLEHFVFLPEQVAGRPVSTRSNIRVKFSMGGESKQQRLLSAAEREEKNSEACLAAKGEESNTLTPVALDSPFKLLDVGG